MRSGFSSSHFMSDGKPAGGQSYGQGFCIAWQNGPLGKEGAGRISPNGAFVEDVIAAAIDRIHFYQDGVDGTETGFWCRENADAISCLEAALAALDSRTKRRVAAGTEGTHNGN